MMVVLGMGTYVSRWGYETNHVMEIQVNNRIDNQRCDMGLYRNEI